MSEWLYAILVLAAGAVCPLHMWWQHRRGRRAACCPLTGPPPPADAAVNSNLAVLRRRQLELSARIAELDTELTHRSR